MDHISHYFVGNDFNNRTLGGMFRKDGAPWCLFKGGDNYAAVSDFVEAERITDPHDLVLKLFVNGEEKQNANTGTMI